MIVYTTQKLAGTAAVSLSPHLYADCHVLNKLRRYYTNLILHQYVVTSLYVFRTRYHTWYSADMVDAAHPNVALHTRYGICSPCVKRAMKYNPELLTAPGED